MNLELFIDLKSLKSAFRSKWVSKIIQNFDLGALKLHMILYKWFKNLNEISEWIAFLMVHQYLRSVLPKQTNFVEKRNKIFLVEFEEWFFPVCTVCKIQMFDSLQNVRRFHWYWVELIEAFIFIKKWISEK